MRGISHLPQFNLRSTMPTIPTRASRTETNKYYQRMQRAQIKNNQDNANVPQSKTNSFFVRINKQNLEQQNRIYKWRMNCSDNFIGIQAMKLQSQGNYYNPNLLFKIDLKISKSNFSQIKDICLTKCVILLKSVLKGVKILLQYFDPIIFTQKMIYIEEDGNAKIWMDQRFYINPNNSLYYKNSSYLTIQDSFRSILAIFQSKCLKTKLCTKLFKILSQKRSISEALSSIDNFQSQQNLFPIQGLKNSVSTGIPLNSSFSLQFSSSRRRKDKVQKDKIFDEYPNKLQLNKYKNMASHKFMQAKSMQLIPNQLKLVKDENNFHNIYKSQQQNAEKTEQKLKRKEKNIFSNSKTPTYSSTTSQLFFSDSPNKSDQNIAFDIQKMSCTKKNSAETENKMKMNSQIVRKSQKSPLEVDRIQAKQDKNPEQENAQSILSRNGWSNNIASLFEKRNIKESFSLGKQQNSHLKDFKLKKLHTMGKQIDQSFLPVDQEFDDF